jgi:hypothetical protein
LLGKLFALGGQPFYLGAGRGQLAATVETVTLFTMLATGGNNAEYVARKAESAGAHSRVPGTE